MIVDSQIHIWGSNLPTNPAHRQITSFTAEDVLKEMDEAGVDAAVIYPPGWDPGADTMALEAAAQHPGRLSILGKFPWTTPPAARWWTVGSDSRGCWGSGSPSSNHTSSLGRTTGPWTGCGPQPRRPVCR